MYTCISYHITYTNVVPKRDMVTCVNKLPLEFALISTAHKCLLFIAPKLCISVSLFTCCRYFVVEFSFNMAAE